MSHSDDQISSLVSMSSDEQLSSDSSEEMEVLGEVQPYVDELPTHMGDKEEDAEEDQNGLSPAVLRSRLEREVHLNEWCVFSFICLMNPSLNQLEAMNFNFSDLAGTTF